MSSARELSPTGEPRAELALIDWRQAWLAPLRALGEKAAGRVTVDGMRVSAALNAALPAALRMQGFRFVEQGDLPPGVAYEQFIHGERRIPTRENLHDFFNGLIWLHFPHTKRLFNQWQAGAIRDRGVGAVRGPLRDAVTVFDENGALLIAPEPLRAALRRREWRRLGAELRPLWARAQLIPLGHALLEKLVHPRKPITAHVFIAEDCDCGLANADADAWMAALFTPEEFAAKPFNPLPVLGVPGWWSENENFCFYDDPLVFRGGARKISQHPGTAADR
ncbi:DUF3025 domain-containing protein [Diaphorobacter ruginosibacter]|uniref:DUF3025 domain-containing protein n=1 Tax=Diaphorobacter ruginosibacter TaxID=1715720 RepID=UPI003342CBC4